MFDWTEMAAGLLPNRFFWALCVAVTLLLAVLILWVELG